VFIQYINIYISFFFLHFKSILTCLLCFISTNHGTNSLNIDDGPLSNKRKNEQANLFARLFFFSFVWKGYVSVRYDE